MKIRKLAALLLAAVLLIAVVSGCSAKSSASMNDSWYSGETAGGGSSGYSTGSSGAPSVPYDDYDKAEAGKPDSGLGDILTAEQNYSEKIIYTAQMELETTEFDKVLEQLEEAVKGFGGFVESSYVSGSSYSSKYYGYQTYRRASYTIRVPAAAFDDASGTLAALGNVTSTSTSASNVTTQYYDLQSRIDAYRTEEQSLLAILEKCETVEDLITVQNRLSEVRYQIETYQTTLNHLDQQVSYSTITLSVNEVQELSKQLPVQRTYWEQIGDGFMESLEDVGRFFKNLFKGIVTSLPVLLLVAAVLVCAVLIVLALLRSRKKKKTDAMHKIMNQEPAEKK